MTTLGSAPGAGRTRLQPLRGARLGRHGEAWATLVLVAAAVLVGRTSSFAATTAAFLMLWVLMAQGWNLISGFTGPLALGQAAFFGVADFFTIVLLSRYGLSQYAGAAVGIVAAVAIAIIVGAITLQRPGFFFAIASLLVPLILEAIVLYLGFYQVERRFFPRPEPSMFWWPGSFPYLVVGAVLVVLAAFGTSILRDRRTGRFLVANRENTRAAESAGVPTFRYKMLAFVLAAILAALAGVIYGQLTFVFDPTDVFVPEVSIQALLLTLVGGSGTVLGPVLGGVIVVPAQQLLNTYVHQAPGLDVVLYALLLLVVAIWLPRGVYPAVRAALARRFRGGAGSAAAAPPRPPDAGLTDAVPAAGAAAPVRARPAREPAAPAEAVAGRSVALEVDRVTVRFGGVTANREVSFRLGDGERVGLIGPNGAGKTTLVNAIAGDLRPAGGRVVLGGVDVTPWQPHRRFLHGLGRTFQIARPFPAMTALESVAIAPLAFGMSPRDAEVRAADALGALNLGHLERRTMREINSVDAKLVELARLAAAELRVVLLDELLAGLVPGERRFVLSVVDEIAARRGWTVLMIEHLVADVRSFCPRTLVLVEGAVIADGPTAEVLSHPRVIEAYLGERWAELVT